VYILPRNFPDRLNVRILLYLVELKTRKSRNFWLKTKNVTLSTDLVKRNEEAGRKSKHHKKNSMSSGHKRQRERMPSGSSVSSLSTECSRVSSQGGNTHRHRDRRSREHGSSKRRKLHQQQQPEEASDHTTLRASSQVSIH
jgi:hypothetical protein